MQLSTGNSRLMEQFRESASDCVAKTVAPASAALQRKPVHHVFTLPKK